MLYTLNLYSAVGQLYLNKTERKIKINKRGFFKNKVLIEIKLFKQ